MQIQTWKKITLGVLGTILLGALGSGLWDVALRPGGQWLVRAILTGASLGSSYLKDQVYVEAAKGFHEADSRDAADELLVFKFWLYNGLVAGMFASLQWMKREARAETEEEAAKSQNEALQKGTARRKPISALKMHASFRVLFTVFLGLALLNVGMQCIEVLRMDTALAAYTYFDQSLRICRPYLTDRQAQMLDSRFASIRSRDDYISITNEMKDTATANKLRLPDFTPW